MPAERAQKIVVFGAGSIGVYIGAALRRAGLPAVLFGRARLAEEINRYGLTISDQSGRVYRLDARDAGYATDPESLRGAELAFVTVKSADTRAAGETLRPLLAPNAVVVSFQNGVRNGDALREAFAGSAVRVLDGMVPYNVLHKGEGRFHCGTSGYLMIAASADDASAQALAALDAAGLEAKSAPNLKAVLWGKLLLNLNNPINALAGVPLRTELGDRRYRRILAAVIREAIGVLKATQTPIARAGRMIPTLAPAILDLPDWLFFRVAAPMVKIDPEARSSMWEDLSRGRKTEIDFLNGEIIALAREHGLAAPLNGAIVELIRQAEAAGAGSPQLGPAELARALGIAAS